MRPFIVIREFKNGDEIPYKELVKEYVMSFAFEAFTSCLFREVILLFRISYVLVHNKEEKQFVNLI